MAKTILYEQLPPELFNLIQEMSTEIKELKRMIQEGDIGVAISEAEFTAAVNRIAQLEEKMVVVEEAINNLNITPEEMNNLLTSIEDVNNKISTLQSYDKNSTQTFTAVMNRISTIEMNHIRLGANELTIPVIVTENIVLPTQDEYMNEITWMSSDEDYITSDGIVYRPSAKDGDKQIVLTANIVAGANSVEKVFTVTVKSLELSEAEKLSYAVTTFDSSFLIGSNDGISISISQDQFLPIEHEGASIVWASSNEGVMTSDGIIYRGINDENVTLTATFTIGAEQEIKQFNIIVLKVEEEVEPPVTEPTDPPADGGETETPEPPTDNGEGEVTPEPEEPIEGEEPPTEPEEPIVDPEQPTDPIDPPVEPEQPTEGESTDPVDPEVTEPTEPEVIEPTDPEVIEPEQPVEPTEPEGETVEPVDPIEPPIEEGEPEVPVEETPTEPEVEPVEPPVEEVEPTPETTEPTEPPIEEGDTPVEPTEPEVEPTEPVEETPVDEGTPEGEGTPETNQTT